MSLLDRAANVGESGDSKLKLFIHGTTGSGKTTLGASFGEVGQKGLYIDFAGEHGFRSVAKKAQPNVDRLSIHTPDEFALLQHELMKETKYEWVLVDSATAMQGMFDRFIHERPQDKMAVTTEGKLFTDGRQKWGEMLDHMTNVATFYYDLADPVGIKKPKHVIFTGLSAMVYDEKKEREYCKMYLRGAGTALMYGAADYLIYTFTEETAGKDISGKDRKTLYRVRLQPKGDIPIKIRKEVDTKPPSAVVGGEERVTLPKLEKLLAKV